MVRLTLDISGEAGALIADAARTSGRAESQVAAELLTEAVKMPPIPGIAFADGPAGRRATLPAVGIDVFTVIGAFRSVGGDWEALKETFNWVPEHLLRAALTYADAYADEIDTRLREEEAWTQERIWAAYSFTRPAGQPSI